MTPREVPAPFFNVWLARGREPLAGKQKPGCQQDACLAGFPLLVLLCDELAVTLFFFQGMEGLALLPAVKKPKSFK